ncbi:FtsW/RodA/SpoVE family cell cycle protein [Fundicoccus sp. Sow4_D5]|uniref:FtsW/RodA/SpoVE family cell cycle protein n=1 Tax=unclassified Fundicoccus TaxID=2761543 RepID=UPI003F8FE6FF
MNNYRREIQTNTATNSETERSHATESLLDKIRQKFALMDYLMLIVMLILILIGFVMIFSATMYYSPDGVSAPEPFSFVMTQFMATMVGLVGLSILVALKYKFFENIIVLNTAMTGLVLSLVFLKIYGLTGGGAQSWISFGFASFQPSEISKIASVLVLARLLQDQQREVILAEEKITSRTKNISILLIAVAVILILFQPDFGMVALIMGTLIIVAMQQYLSAKLNLVMYGLFVVLIGVVNVFGRVASEWLVNHPSYQLNRLGSFTDPFLYPQTAGYQLISGYLAFSRGGWLGVGIGQGVTKRGSLPAGHTDFILAILGEETGLLGIIVVIGLLFVFIFMIYRWAAQSTSHYRRNVLFGIATMFLLQSFINLGGIAGLIPLTGVTLPFVSYGGSSMLVSIMTVAIAQVMIIEEKVEAKKRLEEAYQEEIKAIENARIEGPRKGLTLVHSRKQEE